MSRIGLAPIEIPSGVEVQVGENNVIKVKGPKGELIQKVDPELTVKVEEGEIFVERPTDQKRHKAAHGLYRALLANMIEGVNNGYKLELELHGVGYRASSQGNQLELALGFSHPIIFLLPDEVKVSTETLKGQPPTVILESNDKQLIGQVAAKIKGTRPPEPYKGKGVRFKGEYIRRKAGKSAAAK